MNLKQQYEAIEKRLKRLDLGEIWPGFGPLKFALYDHENCYFNGQYIEKPAEFCANTALSYQGESIAIWWLVQEIDPDLLCAKMVHEMFHAFQEIQGWDCYAREMDALFDYEYEPDNLAMKFHENRLLLELCRGDCAQTFQDVLQSR